jgi:ADP-ribose pyrophosphatase YjhB (NUDIX family)
LILKDGCLLLIRHQWHQTGDGYWVIPGGGIEPDESEEECVIREMKEETSLDVEIERLLWDEPFATDGEYKWQKSYLCRPVGGEAAPGYEPEIEAAENYAISEVRWIDLSDDSEWPDDLYEDPFTYPQVDRLRKRLGY